MCNPPALAAASAGMQILGAVQGHKAQAMEYEVNKRNALQAQEDELRQINVQQAQEETAAAQEKIDTDLSVMEQKARATVAGGESGATLNNNAVLQDMERQG